MSGTLVSVIVPTRDRPAFLRQALESIRAIEGDDLRFEILVGDNGAVPETRAVAEAFGARHIKVAGEGAAASRNAALDAATGDFIAFLDDDDVWLPGNVREHLALLDRRPELEGVLGQVVCVDQNLHPIMAPWPSPWPGEGDDLVRAMLSGYYPQLGATLVRASVAREVGRFDETLLGDQDWDWQLRVARRRKVGFAPVESVLFRQRPPGSFDAMRLRRLDYTRRVFLRHALAEWRIWSSPGRFLDAHMHALWQYWTYFVDAAAGRAALGEMAGARRAISGCFHVFPLRATAHLLTPKPLRKAFVAAFLRPGKASRYSEADVS